MAPMVFTRMILALATSCLMANPDEQNPEENTPRVASDASAEPLVTDRPDFTESTDAVPPRHLQIEMGYTFTYDREGSDRVRDHAAPELLMRIGLIDRLELRLGWAGYSWTESQFETETPVGRTVTHEDWSQGDNDVSVGFKYKLLDQDGSVPDLGVIAAATLPSGTAGLSSGDVDPEVKLLWAYDLTDRLGLAGNLNVGAPTEDAHRFVQASGSVTLGVSLTESLGSYVEYFGFYPNAYGSDCAHYANGGFTYLLNKDCQIDIRVGVGLNEEADDFFTGIGFALRLGGES